MNNNFTNFFGEGFKDMMNLENFNKHSGASSFDFSKLSENMKKNTEAMQEAANVAAESVQSMLKRSTEIVQDNATSMFNAMKEVATSANAEQAIARQQEMVQNLVRGAVSNTKEMLDMASKSAMEVFDKVSKHAGEHMTSSGDEHSAKKSKK